MKLKRKSEIKDLTYCKGITFGCVFFLKHFWRKSSTSTYPNVKYISRLNSTFRNALNKINANLLKNHIPPNIVHAKCSTFTVYLKKKSFNRY